MKTVRPCLLVALLMLPLGGCEREVNNSGGKYDIVEGGTTILRGGNHTLYVPTAWLDPYVFADSSMPLRGLEPLIERHESPGVVHHLKGGYHGVQLFLAIPRRPRVLPADFPVANIEINLIPHVSVHRSPSDAGILGPADEEGWAQFGKGDGFIDTRGGPSIESPYIATIRNGRPPSDFPFPNRSSLTLEDLRILYSWYEADAPQPTWRSLRPRVAKLVEWLATPPAKRPTRPTV